jgi:hypothetical protein
LGWLGYEDASGGCTLRHNRYGCTGCGGGHFLSLFRRFTTYFAG